jgi:nitrate reductase gamma subunit
MQALILGLPAGIATLVGVGLLIYRRRTERSVFKATSVNDKLMYAVLVCALVAGMSCTLMGATAYGEEHDYRQTVSVWFRSIFTLDPRGDLMLQAPIYFQVHVIIALTLFALWPFTRLVHAFSAPIGYLFRPYIVYRSRDFAKKNQPMGSRPPRRGW